MGTQVGTSDSVAIKLYSAALFQSCIKTPNEMKNLTGEAPQQAQAEAKIKGQTSAGMPIVRITDLTSTAGDKVSVDLFNIIGGKPIMGDRNAEGRGERLTFSSMDVSIDQYTKVVDTGGRMTRKRTVHNLRGLAMANLAGYFPKLESQLCFVHMAGARGSYESQDWVVPLQSDAEFTEICVNDVKAPTYNRHYVINGTDLVQGGAQLASIDSADVWTLDHIDALRVVLDESEMPLQPIKISDDPAADDEPLHLILLSPRNYRKLLQQSSGIRTFQQNAFQRASYGSKHPLFRGEFGIWNGFLVRKMNRFIRFAASEAVKHITVANRYTGTETDVTVAAGLSTTHVVERSLVLGAQALANVYGQNQGSDFHFEWLENRYDFKRKLEVAGSMMGGKAKVRFNVTNAAGVAEPTDHGVIVVDAAVAL